MSYDSLLINTCTIKTLVQGPGVDDYGHPDVSWTDTEEPCRLQAGIGKEVLVGAEVVVADYKLFLKDVTITEQDRVIVDSVTYEVLLVADRQNGIGNHHKECFLRLSR